MPPAGGSLILAAPSSLEGVVILSAQMCRPASNGVGARQRKGWSPASLAEAWDSRPPVKVLVIRHLFDWVGLTRHFSSAASQALSQVFDKVTPSE